MTNYARSEAWPLVLLGLLVLMTCSPAQPAPKPDPEPKALPLEKALRKARVDGQYAMLVRQFKAPEDAAKYGDFRDLGQRDQKEYAGLKDLPKGYWVYVYPYWYIWRDRTAENRPKRAWGPEQATGEPDTHMAGDIQTAWASLTPDGQDEWLMLEYAEPVAPEAVLVYETFNPGALCRVTVFKLDGEEVEVWKGKDPTPMNSGMGTSEITFEAPFKTNRVKIYLDSRNVPGWNEIDAVGLRDTAGKTHWAVSAEASSTYAQGNPAVGQFVPAQALIRARVVAPPAVPVPPPMPAPAAVPPPPPAQPPRPAAAPKNNEERIRQLENDVRELKDAVKELKELLKKK